MKDLHILEAFAQFLPVNTTKVHPPLISQSYTLDMFLTGARDSYLFLWDQRTAQKTPIHEQDANELQQGIGLMEPFTIEEGQAEINTITGCTFYNNWQTILSTTANDQIVKVWDLRRIKGGLKKKMFKKRKEKSMKSKKSKG